MRPPAATNPTPSTIHKVLWLDCFGSGSGASVEVVVSVETASVESGVVVSVEAVSVLSDGVVSVDSLVV